MTKKELSEQQVIHKNIYESLNISGFFYVLTLNLVG